ncbi:MAG TPA: hypothetical protein VK961_27865 [Chthoniobacter sp.]|nr:hypothetical protein [Chthoniobacter sp.]
MRLPRLFIVALAGMVLASCKKSPIAAEPATPTPEMKKGHPVVHVPPVETRPFDEGYTAGYEYGKQHATPHGKVATEEEANQAARENAAGQPDRWERGFAEGYADGVRNVVTGQK